MLYRHAKSDWNQATTDHERPLNARGRRDARSMAVFMNTCFTREHCQPEQILCSTASRTRQTLAVLVDMLGYPPARTLFEDSLYLASREHLLQRVRMLESGLQRVMLVGHNDGLELLLELLCPDAPRKDNGRLLATANLAMIRLDTDWRTIQPASGSLDRLVRPDELNNIQLLS